MVPAAPRPATSANSELRQAQLAQLRELEAKLQEEREQTQKLCATLEKESSGRGAGAREAGHIARDRIMPHDGVGNPLALDRASQKLTIAAILLGTMPEPSTPEGRNLHKEAQALLEAAVVQQAESSASRLRSAASAKAGEAAQQDREVSVHTPPAAEARHS